MSTSNVSPQQGQAQMRRRLIEEFFDRAHLSMWACDRSFRVVLWNLGAEQIYGRTKEEMLGRLYYEEFVDEAEREASISDCIRVIDHGAVYRNCLAFDKGLNGQVRYMLTNCFRISDPRTGERYQAEVGVEIGDLELRKNEHRTLREVGIARQAEARLALQARREDFQYRVARLRQEIDITFHSIARELDGFRAASGGHGSKDVESIYLAARHHLEAEYEAVKGELEHLRVAVRNAQTLPELEAIIEGADLDVLAWTDRLRNTWEDK